MEVYRILIPNLQTRINNIVELISDLKDPLAAAQTQAQREMETTAVNTTTATLIGAGGVNETSSAEAQTPGPSVVPTVPNLNPHQLQMTISQLKFHRLKLKDDFDNVYKELRNVHMNADLNRLTELRNKIKDVEDEIAAYSAKLTGCASNAAVAQQANVAAAPVQTATVAAETQTAAVTPSSEHTVDSEQPFDPEEAALHCLNLAVCLLKDPELKSLPPQIRSLCETLIITNIGSIREEIRAVAVKALNMVCILKLDMAQRFVPLLVEIIQRDKREIVIEAFKGMINCIMAFSITKLVNSNEMKSDGASGDDSILIAEATQKIMIVMTSLLDHEDPIVYTTAVEGFCKLYMTGHILSAKLFSKLVIMYYSPLHESDLKLRSILSAFLPQFAFLKST